MLGKVDSDSLVNESNVGISKVHQSSTSFEDCMDQKWGKSNSTMKNCISVADMEAAISSGGVSSSALGGSNSSYGSLLRQKLKLH